MSGSIPGIVLESGMKVSSAGYRITGSAGATVLVRVTGKHVAEGIFP